MGWEQLPPENPTWIIEFADCQQCRKLREKLKALVEEYDEIHNIGLFISEIRKMAGVEQHRTHICRGCGRKVEGTCWDCVGDGALER